MIKNIVFDLDGTLWQTTESYVYAYHKLCERYSIKDKVSDETVKKYLGVRLDVLLNDLFPSVEDKRELALLALGFSVEYLEQNPQNCCYEGVFETLEKLSKNYDLYVVSNCLRGYVETFLRLSGAKDFIKAFYTIEVGEKSQHIRKISHVGEQKTLYVGDCDDDYLSIDNHYRVLFCYAAYGYKSCLQYDYSINNPLELLKKVEEIEIKERQLCGKEFKVISYKDNNLTLIHNEKGCDYFGFVNFVDGDFEKVIDQLKEDARKSLLGPINGNTFYSYRFAIDNFNTVFYPDCVNGAEVVEHFYAKGFKIKQKYVSTVATVNDKMWKLSKLVKLPEGYRVEVVSNEDMFKHVDEIYEVTVDAFSEADFYEEISKRDFIDIYLKDLRKFSSDIVLIYHENNLVGYNFCYEDPKKRYYVCKTTAIKKSERNRKLIMLMVDYSYSLLARKGYKFALHHFQNDRTKTLHAIFKGHEVLQKHYALLEFEK